MSKILYYQSLILIQKYNHLVHFLLNNLCHKVKIFINVIIRIINHLMEMSQLYQLKLILINGFLIQNIQKSYFLVM